MMGESDLRQEMQGMFEALEGKVQRKEQDRRRQVEELRPELERKFREMFSDLDAAMTEREKLQGRYRDTFRGELESFFGFLGPTLAAGAAAVRVIEERARIAEERRTAQKFTTFDLVKLQELDLSRIFGELLDPSGVHGQGDLFLSLLLEELTAGSLRLAHQRLAHQLYWLSQPVDGRRALMHLEYPTGPQPTSDGKRREGKIDIVLELEDHCWIGIENKPWAIDQDAQVERYWQALYDKADHDMDRVIMLYWSGDGSDPWLSERENVAEKGRQSGTRQEQRMPSSSCITMPYRKHFGVPSVEGWLRRCWVECEADRLRTFVGDLLDYLRMNFRNLRIPHLGEVD